MITRIGPIVWPIHPLSAIAFLNQLIARLRSLPKHCPGCDIICYILTVPKMRKLAINREKYPRMLPPVFGRALGLVALLAALCCAGCAADATGDIGRKDIVLKTGWRFIRKDLPSAQSTGFDDAGWQAVTLPHTWNALDGQDGGDNYYRGACWYRLNLPLDSTVMVKQLFLRFEAASLVADVFVNGRPVGRHVGGFAAFCFDITGLVHAGNNIVAVRVDNSHSPDIPPLSGDFTICGGLYRNVHLLILNKISISPTDDASPGIYLKPVQVDDKIAIVNALARLRNDSDEDQTVIVRFTIRNAADHEVAATQMPQTIPAHSKSDSTSNLTIESPHFWNGRDDPYLYHATIDLIQNGMLLDRVVQPLGLRSFRVDAQKGFILNGRPYPLHGVAVHQDYFNKGWAITSDDIDKSYRLIEEMGCTTVRLAHYQHPDYEYSLCDHAGIVVWAEACLVNRIGDTAAFSENAKQQVRELIKQNYNHPSIFFWSLFNELGPRTRTDWQLVHDLNDIAHDLDPDRRTVAASHLPAQIPLNGYTDIIGFNRYFGWYTGTIADWPTELDKLRATLPNRAIGISEYGAGASVLQHEEHPTTQPSTKGHWHPEEWQSTVHETAWRAIKDRPWLWATYVWSMFDFASDARDEGDTPGRNDKGLVTADREIKKDAFYFYKANWTEDPFVHICEKRFDPRPVGPAELKVYSNCDSVELFLNGKSLGNRSCSDHVFVWNQVLLRQGKCELAAVGEKNAQRFVDDCSWTVSSNVAPRPFGQGVTTRPLPDMHE
jgi:beta-galactosidase